MKLLTFLLFFVLLSLPAVAQVGGLLDSMKANPNFLPGESLVHDDAPHHIKENEAFERRLGRALSRTPEQGKLLLRKIIDVGKKKKVIIAVYYAFRGLIRYLYRGHDYEQAMELIKEASNYFSHHWKEGEGRMYMEASYVLGAFMGEHRLGLEYSFKAEAIFINIPEQFDRYANIIGNIGRGYQELNQIDSMLFYLHKQVQITEKNTNWPNMTLGAKVGLAEGYVIAKKYNTAINILNNMDKYQEGAKFMYDMVYGMALMGKGEYQKALPYLEFACNHVIKDKNRIFIDKISQSLAECYAKLERHKEAFTYLQKADSMKSRKIEENAKIKGLKSGFKFEKERNQLKTQLEQERLEAENNNKVLKIENEKTAIQSKNALTELEKKALQSKNAEDSLKAKNEKDRLQAQSEQERQLAVYQQNQLRTTTYITLLIAFLVLSGLLYFLYTNRKINKQNAELEKQKIFIKHRLTNDFITVLGILDAKKRTADSVGKEAIASTVFPISALQDATLALLENSSLSIKAQMERMAKNLSEGLRKPDSISIESDELALVGSSALATLFIANELMYNSFKYNKEKPDLHIRIRMKKVNEQDFSFVFEDNGTGLGNQTFAELSKNRNKGMGLLKAYTQTLKATPQVESSENGLVFRFVGKIKNN